MSKQDSYCSVHTYLNESHPDVPAILENICSGWMLSAKRRSALLVVVPASATLKKLLKQSTGSPSDKESVRDTLGQYIVYQRTGGSDYLSMAGDTVEVERGSDSVEIKNKFGSIKGKLDNKFVSAYSKADVMVFVESASSASEKKGSAAARKSMPAPRLRSSRLKGSSQMMGGHEREAEIDMMASTAWRRDILSKILNEFCQNVDQKSLYERGMAALNMKLQAVKGGSDSEPKVRNALIENAMSLMMHLHKHDSECFELLSDLITFDESDVYILLEPCGPMFGDAFLVSDEQLKSWLARDDDATIGEAVDAIKAVHAQKPDLSSEKYIAIVEQARVELLEHEPVNQIPMLTKYYSALSRDNKLKNSQGETGQLFSPKLHQLLKAHPDRKHQLDELKYVVNMYMTQLDMSGAKPAELKQGLRDAHAEISGKLAALQESPAYRCVANPDTVKMGGQHKDMLKSHINSTLFLAVPLTDVAKNYIEKYFNTTSAPTKGGNSIYVAGARV